MKIIYCLIGVLIPFFATTLGSSFVFFLKNNLNNKIKKFLIGLSIGVMLSSSIFSLLIPSIEMSSIKWLSPTIGIIVGFIFLIIVNKFSSKKDSSDMTMLSVTFHNIPEGMVVGASFAGAIFGNDLISLTSAFMVSIAIAVQNIPEGTIISIPYRIKGKTKFQSFLMGSFSGIVEPLFGSLTILLSKYITIMLPYLFSFAFGAMIYVIIDELATELNENKSYFGMIGVMIGLIIMMILDISFA